MRNMKMIFINRTVNENIGIYFSVLNMVIIKMKFAFRTSILNKLYFLLSLCLGRCFN